MNLPIVFRKIAKKEFDSAYAWYESRRGGLGDEFVAEVNQVLSIIALNPKLHAVAHRDLRAALVKRFPYAIYYRIAQNQIRVVGVIHTARDPSIWQRRR